MTTRPLALFATMPVAFDVINVTDANELLLDWGHYLGPVNRPFGSQAWALEVDGAPVAVAVSCSTVSQSVAGIRRDGVLIETGLRRGQVVELARLCAAPGASWATRVMVRLWREVAARRWPYWPVEAAVAYSQNARHDGRIYRFDGWAKITDRAGSNGGGAWSRPRYATHAAHGRKTLWLWRYEASR